MTTAFWEGDRSPGTDRRTGAAPLTLPYKNRNREQEQEQGPMRCPTRCPMRWGMLHEPLDRLQWVPYSPVGRPSFPPVGRHWDGSLQAPQTPSGEPWPEPAPIPAPRVENRVPRSGNGSDIRGSRARKPAGKRAQGERDQGSTTLVPLEAALGQGRRTMEPATPPSRSRPRNTRGGDDAPRQARDAKREGDAPAKPRLAHKKSTPALSPAPFFQPSLPPPTSPSRSGTPSVLPPRGSGIRSGTPVCRSRRSVPAHLAGRRGLPGWSVGQPSRRSAHHAEIMKRSPSATICRARSLDTGTVLSSARPTSRPISL